MFSLLRLTPSKPKCYNSPMITKVTSADFNDLVNPYTGKQMIVMMNVTPAGVTFFAPDTYSTYERLPTPEECYRKWNRVNDIEGGRTGKPIQCAYTGEPLSVVHTDFGCYFRGGFDPRMFHTRESFLYYATMRGGVSKYPKPDGRSPRVTAPPRKPSVTKAMSKHAEKETPKLDDDKIHMVENALKPYKAVIPGSSTVSMSQGTKSRARR